MPEGFTLQQISGDKVQHGVLTAYNKKNTIDLEIQKVDVNNTSKKLNGAEFTLKMLDISQPGVHYPSWAVSWSLERARCFGEGGD